MAPTDRLARWMAEQAEAQRDVEARELLAKIRHRMFARRAQAPALGRYRDLERIGAGGMGIVYSALDPRLGRRVALKVVRLTPGAAQSDMLREARLLARTPHPNIVPVLDVGMDGDETFIAMELIEGQTFDDWMDSTEVSPGAAVAVLAQAGRGLAAAHEQGVVHLDFKPTNVLVGSDGRVRVTDFGLARELGGARVSTLDKIDEIDEPSDASCDQTRRGLGGTLGYAAPEQLDPTARVDGRADQFALAVCLFEALTGRLPWSAASPEHFVSQVRAGPPSIGCGQVSRRTVRVIERALRVDPKRRFSSMNDMLAALGTGNTTGPRTRAGVFALVFGPATVLGAWIVGQPGAPRCPAADELAAQWDDAQRGRVARAFLASGLPYADESFAAVDARLTEAVAKWGAEYRAMCGASDQRRDELGLDAGLVCLDAQRGAIEALVDLLPRADATTVERSVDSVAALPVAARCRDATDRRGPETTADRRVAKELARRTAAARSLMHAGAYDEARAKLGTLPRQASEAAHGALLAELAATQGEIANGRGRFGEAEQAWIAAYHLAVAAGDDRRAALCAADLVRLVGVELVRLDEAARWQRHAEAAVERWGDDDPGIARVDLAVGTLARERGELELAEARLSRARDRLGRADGHDNLRSDVLLSLGMVRHDAGDFTRSTPVIEEALRLLEVRLGPHHPQLIAPLTDLSVNALSVGDNEGARQYAERGLALATATLGPLHTRTAAIENNLGNVHVSLLDDERAQRHFERALEIFTARLGKDNPQTVSPLVNLASLHGRAGRYERARRALRSALDIVRRAKGERDLVVARLYVNLGFNEHMAGDRDAAMGLYRQGLVIFEERLGADHVDVATVRANLGSLAFEHNDVETAVAELSRAREIRIAALGAEHPAVGYVGLNYGEALAATEQLSEARDVLSSSLAIVAAGEPMPTTIARGQLVLATVLRRLGDGVGAMRLLQAVRDQCAGAEPPDGYVCTAAREEP